MNKGETLKNLAKHFTFSEHQRTPLLSGAEGACSSDEINVIAGKLSDLLARYPTKLFTLDNKNIITEAYCGVYATKDFCIQVIPKFVGGEAKNVSRALRNLSHMLERTGLDVEIPLTFESLTADEGSFLESLAFHYAYSLRRALKIMPLLQYQVVSQSLMYKRGRISVPDTMKNSVKSSTSLHCVFDSYDRNNAINQVFHTICQRLLKVCSRDITRKLLYDCKKELFGDGSYFSIPENIKSLKLGKQWSVYQRPWKLALLMLRQQSMDFQSSGDTPISLEFDMNKVFESYVGTLIRDLHKDFLDKKVNLSKEITLADTTLTSTALITRENIKGRIDIDIESDSSQSFIIDTKYKLLGQGKNPSTDDIFQVLSYAEYRSRQTKKQFTPLLIYPKTSQQNNKIYYSEIAGWNWVTGFINFDDDLRKTEENAKASLSEALHLAESMARS